MESYSQQLPLLVHVLPQTKQFLSNIQPNIMGAGTKHKREINIMPKPIMADLSSGATERIVMSRFEARPVAAKNLMTHITARNVINWLEQFIVQAPSVAWPPVPNES